MAGPAKVTRPKRPKTLTQTKIELEGPGRSRRYVLMDPKATRAAARGRTTRILKGGWTPGTGSAQLTAEGESLYKGVLGMAQTALVDSATYAKLERMDPEKLRIMYDQNKMIFDAYYSYEGINYAPGQGWVVNEGAKRADVDFLIEQYQKFFGPL